MAGNLRAMLPYRRCLPAELRPAVLLNPLSGMNRKKKVNASEIAARFAIPVIEVTTPSDIEVALCDLSDAGINLLVVSGGDGTVQAVMTALFARRPFSVLPLLLLVAGGTTNMTAADVGMRGTLISVLQKIDTVTGRAGCRIMNRHVMQVSVPVAGVFYGMFVATAGICDAMAFYREKFHGQGLWGIPGIVLTFLKYVALSVTGKRGRGTWARPVTVTVDESGPVKDDFLVIMVTTLDRLIFGIRPFARGQGRGPLRFAALSSGSRGLWFRLPLLFAGRSVSKGRQDGYWLASAEGMELCFDGQVSVDGELYDVRADSGPVTVDSGGILSFLRV